MVVDKILLFFRKNYQYSILFSYIITVFFSVLVKIASNIIFTKFIILTLSFIIYAGYILTLIFLIQKQRKILLIGLIFVVLNIYLLYNFRLPLIYNTDYLTHYQNLNSLTLYNAEYYNYILPNLYSYPIVLSLYSNALFINTSNIFNIISFDFFVLINYIQIYSLLFYLCFLVVSKKFKYYKLFYILLYMTIFDFFPVYSLRSGSLVFVLYLLVGFIVSFFLMNLKAHPYFKFLLFLIITILSFFMSPAVALALLFFNTLLFCFLYFTKSNIIAFIKVVLRTPHYLKLIFFFLIIFILATFLDLVDHYKISNSSYVNWLLLRQVSFDINKIFSNLFLSGFSQNNSNYPVLAILYLLVIIKLLMLRKYIFVFLYILSIFISYLGIFYYSESFLGQLSRNVSVIWLGQVERLLPTLILTSLVILFHVDKQIINFHSFLILLRRLQYKMMNQLKNWFDKVLYINS
jgi:hypothetical protein